MLGYFNDKPYKDGHFIYIEHFIYRTFHKWDISDIS